MPFWPKVNQVLGIPVGNPANTPVIPKTALRYAAFAPLRQRCGHCEPAPSPLGPDMTHINRP
jgi:hypothetical protein